MQDKPLHHFSSSLVYPPVHHHLTFDLFSQWAPFLTDLAAVRMTKGERGGREGKQWQDVKKKRNKFLHRRLRAFSLKPSSKQIHVYCS